MQIYLGTWTLKHTSYPKIVLLLSLDLENAVAEDNKATLQDLHLLAASGHIVLLSKSFKRVRVTEEHHVGSRDSAFCGNE